MDSIDYFRPPVYRLTNVHDANGNKINTFILLPWICQLRVPPENPFTIYFAYLITLRQGKVEEMRVFLDAKL